MCEHINEVCDCDCDCWGRVTSKWVVPGREAKTNSRSWYNPQCLWLSDMCPDTWRLGYRRLYIYIASRSLSFRLSNVVTARILKPRTQPLRPRPGPSRPRPRPSLGRPRSRPTARAQDTQYLWQPDRIGNELNNCDCFCSDIHLLLITYKLGYIYNNNNDNIYSAKGQAHQKGKTPTKLATILKYMYI